MPTKTDYTTEIQRLLTDYYAPVIAKEAATDQTIKKTLSDIHQDITNVLPSRWVYQEDIYNALNELGFKPFPFKNEEGGGITFYYYLEPK